MASPEGIQVCDALGGRHWTASISSSRAVRFFLIRCLGYVVIRDMAPDLVLVRGKKPGVRRQVCELRFHTKADFTLNASMAP